MSEIVVAGPNHNTLISLAHPVIEGSISPIHVAVLFEASTEIDDMRALTNRPLQGNRHIELRAILAST